MIYQNGDKYEGDWENGLRHGLGTLWIYIDGKYVVRFNGSWHKDKPAVRNCLCNQICHVQGRERVWGEKQRDSLWSFWAWLLTVSEYLQGSGVFFGEEGELYEGDFKNGKRCGRGKQTIGGRAVDGFGGTVYEGEWMDDAK